MFSVLESKSFPVSLEVVETLVVVNGSVIYSIKVNLASLWKLWFEFWKCLQARIGFLFLLSVLWLFNLILKEAWLLPVYSAFRVYSKHLFRSVTRQKYSIFNWVLKLNLHKKLFYANKSRFYCLSVKKKTRCFIVYLYLPHLT